MTPGDGQDAAAAATTTATVVAQCSPQEPQQPQQQKRMSPGSHALVKTGTATSPGLQRVFIDRLLDLLVVVDFAITPVRVRHSGSPRGPPDQKID